MARETAEAYLRQYWCYIMLDLPGQVRENDFVQGVVNVPLGKFAASAELFEYLVEALGQSIEHGC